jgi:hypothetical protein
MGITSVVTIKVGQLLIQIIFFKQKNYLIGSHLSRSLVYYEI